MFRKQIKWIIYIFLFWLIWQFIYPLGQDQFYTLCYHDIPKALNDDAYGVDERSFVETIEYLLSHGYTFVSLNDILLAHEGRFVIPEKSVLLTFDDAYKSFYDFVFPLLKRYEIPCILSVVTSWIDKSGHNKINQYFLMSWEEIKEVSDSGWVEVVSHSHDQHKGIIYNSMLNKGPSMTSRFYDVNTGIYEDNTAYESRIRNDLRTSWRMLEEKLGKEPRALCWPYGRYSELTLKIANEEGFKYTFILGNQKTSIQDLSRIKRFITSMNPTPTELVERLQQSTFEPMRAVQVDLDYIYDKDMKQFELNLGLLLDRIKEMKPSHVFLQAFCDVEGKGNIRELYFHNSKLPVKADIFNRTVHQLKTRCDVKVFAWLPVLSFVLNNENLKEMRVFENKEGEINPSSSWYERLSPFHPKVFDEVKTIYKELAIYSWIDGIIFQDDAYLTDYEDFNPYAIEQFEERFPGDELEGKKWKEFKIRGLNRFTQELVQTVKYYRPESKFARTFYAKILTHPESQNWFSQSFNHHKPLYDYYVVMAYPYMEEVKKPIKWLENIVDSSRKLPIFKRMVFKVQTYDWKKKTFIPTSILNEWLAALVRKGVQNIAYYPDYYIEDHPGLKGIKYLMSTNDFPYNSRYVRKKGGPN